MECLASMDFSIIWCNMFFLARQCVIRKTQVHISKVKVTKLGQRLKRGIFCCVLAITPSCMDECEITSFRQEDDSRS